MKLHGSVSGLHVTMTRNQGYTFDKYLIRAKYKRFHQLAVLCRIPDVTVCNLTLLTV